jgi:hypothetical protein
MIIVMTDNTDDSDSEEVEVTAEAEKAEFDLSEMLSSDDGDGESDGSEEEIELGDVDEGDFDLAGMVSDEDLEAQATYENMLQIIEMFDEETDAINIPTITHIVKNAAEDMERQFIAQNHAIRADKMDMDAEEFFDIEDDSDKDVYDVIEERLEYIEEVDNR